MEAEEDQKADPLIRSNGADDKQLLTVETNPFMLSHRSKKFQTKTMRRLMQNIRDERVDLNTLSRVEMDRAQELIDMEHPLQNSLIWVILPFLKPIKRWLPKCIPKQHDPDDDSENVNEV